MLLHQKVYFGCIWHSLGISKSPYPRKNSLEWPQPYGPVGKGLRAPSQRDTDLDLEVTLECAAADGGEVQGREDRRGARLRDGRGGRTERTCANSKKGTAVSRCQENWVLVLVWEQSSVALNKSLPSYDLKFVDPPKMKGSG